MVGKGLAAWRGGARQLVWLLTDVVVVITHPFLAAAVRGPGQTGPRAAPVGQRHLVRTEGHAAHHSVHACALVLAVGLKVLAVLVHPATELARQTLCLSCQQITGTRAVRTDLIFIEAHSRKLASVCKHN